MAKSAVRQGRGVGRIRKVAATKIRFALRIVGLELRHELRLIEKQQKATAAGRIFARMRIEPRPYEVFAGRIGPAWRAEGQRLRFSAPRDHL